MQQSGEVREAMLRFYDWLSASDVASFDQLVSQDPATLIIGTAPGVWVTERDQRRFGFQTEGVRIQAARGRGLEAGAHARLCWRARRRGGRAAEALSAS
jgi:ketosteroid isomerase-like protein